MRSFTVPLGWLLGGETICIFRWNMGEMNNVKYTAKGNVQRWIPLIRPIIPDPLLRRSVIYMEATHGSIVPINPVINDPLYFRPRNGRPCGRTELRSARRRNLRILRPNKHPLL